MQYELFQGDCVETMRAMPDNSVDSIVTDPPYELGFMGKAWDASGIANNPIMWAEALRVLKPGGHLLAFSGSRTYHRMTCAIEDAGFEVRDQIMWVYGSGFPKSLDVSKAIDKANGRGLEDWYELGRHIRACRLAKGLTTKDVNAHFGGTALCNHWEAQNQNNAIPPTPEHWTTLKDWLGCSFEYDEIVDRAGAAREVIGQKKSGIADGNTPRHTIGAASSIVVDITAPATDAARQWEGWGTALKPAHEPICVARKPLIGTVAANVLAHGTGALNIDGCRVDGKPRTTHAGGNFRTKTGGATMNEGFAVGEYPAADGRWPANLIHDGSAEVVALFPDSKGQQGATAARSQGDVYGAVNAGRIGVEPRDDSGSAARFFYCAKTSKADRNEGLAEFTARSDSAHRKTNLETADTPHLRGVTERVNAHPTVKPTDLMAYLCRLVTPPGGLILDLFMGSGSTGKAAMREGFRFIGCELSAEYLAIAEARISHELIGDLL